MHTQLTPYAPFLQPTIEATLRKAAHEAPKQAAMPTPHPCWMPLEVGLPMDIHQCMVGSKRARNHDRNCYRSKCLPSKEHAASGSRLLRTPRYKHSKRKE